MTEINYLKKNGEPKALNPKTGKPAYWDDGMYTTITFKIEPKHKELLLKLADMLQDTASHIIRRLVVEELYFRGMTDDGATDL